MPSPLPPAALKVFRTLWGALTASSGIFLFILTRVPRPNSTPPDALFIPIAFVAFGCMVVSIVLPRRVLGQMKHRSIAAYQTALILGLALTESIALFGFVLGFQNFPPDRYLPFFAIAWVLFLLRFPRATHPLGHLGPAYGEG